MIYSNKKKEGNIISFGKESGNSVLTNQNYLKGNIYLYNTIYNKPFSNAINEDKKLHEIITCKTNIHNFQSYDYLNTKKPAIESHSFQRISPLFKNNLDYREPNTNYLQKGNINLDNYKINNLLPKKNSNILSMRSEELLLSNSNIYSNRLNQIGKNYFQKSIWPEINSKRISYTPMYGREFQEFEKLHNE